jgi:hypothetical protein
VYYLYYLKEKKEDELSGLEQAVIASFARLNTDWVPIGSTLHLDADEDDDQIAALGVQLTTLEDEVKAMNKTNESNHKSLMRDIQYIKDLVGNDGGDQSIEGAIKVQAMAPTSGKKGILSNRQEASPLGKPPLSKTMFPVSQSMRENTGVQPQGQSEQKDD